MIFWCLNNKTISNYKKSTYGSFMCMLFDAYEILGHATVNITMNRYVHPTLELKKENMKKLSSLLAVK